MLLKALRVVMKLFYICNIVFGRETGCATASTSTRKHCNHFLVHVGLCSVTLPGLVCDKGLYSNANHKDDE